MLGNGHKPSKGESATKIGNFSEQRNKLFHLYENTFCLSESLQAWTKALKWWMANTDSQAEKWMKSAWWWFRLEKKWE